MNETGTHNCKLSITTGYKSVRIPLIWILFIVWLFAARVWISPAAPTSDKTVQVADFNDVAKKAGLTATNVFGEKDHTTYVLESTGTGVAIFDYDNDGWPDIFLVNGSTLKGFPVEKLSFELRARQF